MKFCGRVVKSCRIKFLVCKVERQNEFTLYSAVFMTAIKIIIQKIKEPRLHTLCKDIIMISLICRERCENHHPQNLTNTVMHYVLNETNRQTWKYVSKQPLGWAPREYCSKKQKHHQHNPWFSLWQVGISAFSAMCWLQHGNSKTRAWLYI